MGSLVTSRNVLSSVTERFELQSATLAQTVPGVPYPAAKCFWVELTGKWRGTVYGKDGAADVVTEYPDEAAADAGKWDMLSPLYRLPDGSEVDSRDLPPGAIYGSRDEGYHRGPDGWYIWAVCPDGTHWAIDGRCSNCGRPDDKEHHCWIRDGDPRTGLITVSKGNDPAKTCNAGGGSIQTDKYHGKLENGEFGAG